MIRSMGTLRDAQIDREGEKKRAIVRSRGRKKEIERREANRQSDS